MLPIPVPLHHMGAPGYDLSNFAHRHIMAFFIDDTYLAHNYRPAAGLEPLRVIFDGFDMFLYSQSGGLIGHFHLRVTLHENRAKLRHRLF